MRFPCGWCDPCYTPKLLGVYERELQAIVLGFATRGYRTVINAGCAEGYYAVGLARALPRVEVLAFDSEPRARERCAELAALNQVSDRVTIGGTVRPEALAGHPLPALLVCDVEGAENELLDPLKAPALVDMDILVEVHDVFVEGTTERLTARFGDSHRITPVASGSVDLPALPELDGMEQMDRLLAYWEGRLAGTHWLWMSVG